MGIQPSVIDIRDWQLPMFASLEDKQPSRKYEMENYIIFQASDIDFVDDGDGLEVRIPFETVLKRIPKNRQYITTVGRFGSVGDVNGYYHPRFEKMGVMQSVEFFVGAWMESGKNGKRALSAYIKTMDALLDFCKQYSGSSVNMAIRKIKPSKCNTSYLSACLKNAEVKRGGRPRLVVNNPKPQNEEVLDDVDRMFR